MTTCNGSRTTLPATLRWFGSPYRGNFDFTFDMSPSLLDVNPVALKYFYDEAASDPNKTYFATAGGWGLNYPSQTPDIAGFMNATVSAMQAVDQNVISVLDDTPNLSKLQQMVARPEVMGLMLKTGSLMRASMAPFTGTRGSQSFRLSTPYGTASIHRTQSLVR